MEIKKDSTEDKILEAAKNVFVAKGMEGARMQEIADEAGINKALLHYYFRSKEKLFEAIFSKIIQFAFPEITRIAQSNEPFISKIEQVVDAYIDLLIKHPFIPGFIMKELNRDPSGLFKLVVKFGLNPQVIFDQIQLAMDRDEIIQMQPRHLAANIISMCIFPFAARPLVSFVLFKDDQVALNAFYVERADVIKKFVIDAIVIKK
ncbi:transcriptional regulator, TetR family [Aquipluma nitroreducens]|uniref:Transcriptional regulator, TetR family n=1 Tax=Aquipluma nitroreducens TaxID=2010828 RepID=A0A5K7S6V6_9BACT|nr:TetR/AcrR family transcriptional regulator [Aquipluma nitroreducens]BBE17288.1 transcriptional regulator, TetR family [Aquipluma nitroreducens]